MSRVASLPQSVRHFVSPPRNTILPRETTVVPVNETIVPIQHVPMTQYIVKEGKSDAPKPKTKTTVKTIVKDADHSYCEQRIHELTAEVEQWRRKYLELQAEQDRNASYEDTIAHLQTRIEILIDENRKLNAALKGRINDIEECRITIQEMEQLLHSFKSKDEDFNRLKELLSAKHAECEDWKSKFHSQEATIRDQESRNRVLQQEVASWKERALKSEKAAKDLEDQLKKANELLSKTQQGKLSQEEIDKLYSQVRKLKDQLANAQQEASSYKSKAQSLEQQVQAGLQKIQDLENHVKLLQDDNQRLHKDLLEAKQEISALHPENQRLQPLEADLLQSGLEIEDLEEKHALKSEQVDDLKNQIHYLEMEIAELHDKLEKANQLQADNGKLKVEIEKLQSQLRDKNRELEGQVQKNATLDKINAEVKADNLKIEPLEANLKLADQEKQALENRIQNKDEVAADLLKQVDKLTHKVAEQAMLAVELEKTKQQLALKEKEAANLKEAQLKALQELQGLRQLPTEVKLKTIDAEDATKKAADLKNQLKAKQQEAAALEFEAANLAAQLKEIPFLEEQNKQIKAQLKEALNEVNDWRANYGKLGQENLELQAANDVLNDKLNQALADKQRLDKLLQNANGLMTQARNEANQFELEGFQQAKKCGDLNELLEQQQKLRDNAEQECKQVKDQLDKLNKQFNQLDLMQKQQQRSAETEKLNMEGQLHETQLLADQRTDEAKNWKGKYLESEKAVSDLQFVGEQLKQEQGHSRQLEVEIERLKNKHLKLPQGIVEHVVDSEGIDALRKQVAELQHENTDQYNETQRLKGKIDQLKYEQKQSADQQNFQIQENDRLKALLTAKITENEQLRAKSNVQQQEIVDLKFLEQRVPELEAVVQLNNEHIGDLNQQFTEKNKDYEKLYAVNVKQQVDLEQLASLEADNKRLDVLRKNGLATVEEYKNKLSEKEYECDKANKEKEYWESKFNYLALELEKSKVKARQLDDDYVKLQKEFDDLKKFIDDAKALEQHFKQMERDIAVLQEDNNRLKQQNQDQEDYIKQLEEQLRQLQAKLKEHANDINELQSQLEIGPDLGPVDNLEEERALMQAEHDQQLKDLENQLRDLEAAKNKEIEDLAALVERLKNDLKKAQQQNDRLRDDNEQLKQDNNDKDQLIKELEKFRNEYNKYKLLYEQELLNSKDLREQLGELKTEYSTIVKERDGLLARVGTLQNEIQQIANQVKDKNQENADLSQKLTQLETQLGLLKPFEAENTRLKQTIEQLNKEIAALKAQLADQVVGLDVAGKNKQTQDGQIKALQSEIAELTKQLNSRTTEFNQLKTTTTKQENQQVSLAKVVDTTNVNEIKQLTDQVQQKSREAEDAKKKANQLDLELQKVKKENMEVGKLQQTIQSKDKELDELRKKIEKMTADMNALEKLKNDHESKLALLSSEIERGNKKYENAQGEMKRFQQQIQDLSNEVSRLGNDNTKLNNDVQAWSTKYANVMKDIQPNNNNNANPSINLGIPDRQPSREASTRQSGVQQPPAYGDQSNRSSGYNKQNLFPKDQPTSGSQYGSQQKPNTFSSTINPVTASTADPKASGSVYGSTIQPSASGSGYQSKYGRKY